MMLKADMVESSRRVEFLEVIEQEHWIDSPGGRLFAKSWTPAEPTSKSSILLFHDSLGSVELWRDFPRLLSKTLSRRVVAYDRLGFGRSDARTDTLSRDFIAQEAERYVDRICSTLGIRNFVALGHSVGGGMAVEVGVGFPDRCVAIVTVSAQAFVERRTIEGIRAARITFAQRENIARLEKYHGDKAAWVLGAWIETWLAPEFADWSLEATLRNIRCPILAIHGDRDEYGSAEHPRRISRGRGEMRLLADVGHNPHREDADLVVDAVRSFLDGASVE